MNSTIRAREPRELLAVVPHQIGYVPISSVVVVSLRGPRRRVGLMARSDVVDLADAGRGAQHARNLVAVLGRDDALECIAIVYCDGAGATCDEVPEPARVAVRQIRAACAGVLGVHSVLAVRGGSYYEWCDDDRLLRLGGLEELEATQTAAHMVLTGSQVASSRADLARLPRPSGERLRRARRGFEEWRGDYERLLEPSGRGPERDLAPDLDPDDDAARAALAHWRSQSMQRWRRAVQLTAAASGADDTVSIRDRVPAVEVGRLGAVLADRRMRDAVLVGTISAVDALADLTALGTHPEADRAAGSTMAAIFDQQNAARPDAAALAPVRELLCAIAAHLPGHQRAPALTLLGVLAWWRGCGAEAAVWLERALRADGAYRLALLTSQMLAHGLPPSWVQGDR
ncbi:MAG: DUF4192 domain-containing protein [Cellulomonadaceae bacterium]